MAPTNTIELPILTQGDLNLADGTPVISAAQKFVIPIPAFGAEGEPLVYPVGHADAGKPIKDWQGRPVGEKGIVFWNEKDKAWQAALGDGNAVIIMNNITDAQAATLFGRYSGLGNPLQISIHKFKEFLRFASTALGITDIYNTEKDFIADHMTPVNPERFAFDVGGQTFGFMKRDARDIAVAVFVDGQFLFEMEEAHRPTQRMEDGGVIVAIPNPKGAPSIHAVNPDVFARTYRLADGGKEITSLRTQIRVMSLLDLAVAVE